MIKNNQWKKSIITLNANINEAIKKLDLAELQILIVVDKYNKFLGTITDGDVRRALLKGLSLKDKINHIVNFKPIIAPPGTEIESIKKIMAINSINQLPIIDKKRKDPDKRDYIVSNQKILATGWKPSFTIDDGIVELIKCYDALKLQDTKNV